MELWYFIMGDLFLWTSTLSENRKNNVCVFKAKTNFILLLAPGGRSKARGNGLQDGNA